MVNQRSEKFYKPKTKSTVNKEKLNNNQLDSMVNLSKSQSVSTVGNKFSFKSLFKSSTSSLTNYGNILITINLLTFIIYTNGIPIEEFKQNLVQSVPSSNVYHGKLIVVFFTHP